MVSALLSDCKPVVDSARSPSPPPRNTDEKRIKVMDNRKTLLPTSFLPLARSLHRKSFHAHATSLHISSFTSRWGHSREERRDSSVDWYVSSKKQLDSIMNRENPQVQRRRRRRQSNEIRAHRDAFSAYTSSSNGVAEENGIEDEEDPSTVPLIVRDKIKSIILFVMPLMASNVISPLLTMTDTAFVGRYASDAVVSLAALGVATPLTDYPVNLFMFVTAGVTSIVSNGLAVREPKHDMERKVY